MFQLRSARSPVVLWASRAFVGVSCIALAQAAPKKAVPAEVDLRPQFTKMGLAPLAQGNRDTCSLFAITALAEFESQRHKTTPPRRLSEEFLIWAADCATGKEDDQAMFYEAVHGLETLGICEAGLMPYAPSGKARHAPSPKARERAREMAGHWRVHWLRRWNVARPLNDAELERIKAALVSGHPVACGLRWPKQKFGAVLREVPRPQDVFDGHSIVLVGYTDNPKQKGGGMFLFRNSAGPAWGENGYGRMSYAYVQAYANDALWLQYLPGHPEAPIERFEAETMSVLSADRCEVSPQQMTQWGGPMWGGGRQLFCRAQHDGSVTLALPARRAGRYRLRVLATAAPDYGALRATVNGKHVGHDINLYSGRVCPSGAIELGSIDLAAGQHSLRFTSVGKDPASTDVWFGLDAVELFDD
jgi:Papain family cysteine protease